VVSDFHHSNPNSLFAEVRRARTGRNGGAVNCPTCKQPMQGEQCAETSWAGGWTGEKPGTGNYSPPRHIPAAIYRCEPCDAEYPVAVTWWPDPDRRCRARGQRDADRQPE